MFKTNQYIIFRSIICVLKVSKMVIIYILTMYQIQTNKGMESAGEGQEQELAGGHKQRTTDDEWQVGGKHKHHR
jgi:hypothetical protein